MKKKVHLLGLWFVLVGGVAFGEALDCEKGVPGDLIEDLVTVVPRTEPLGWAFSSENAQAPSSPTGAEEGKNSYETTEAVPSSSGSNMESFSSSYTASMIRMITALATLLIIVVAAAWAVKRFKGGGFSSISSNKRIKILERRPLSQKSVLYLVELEGKKILFAESQLEIRRLASFTEKEAHASLEDEE